MPILDNPKHERFAQALAAGETSDAAYVLAGYKRNDGNASRLKGNDGIAARVAEIQSAICAGVVIERQWTLLELHKIASAPIGDPIISVAEKRKALGDIARIEGWIVTKLEHSGGLSISHEQALEALK